MIPVLFLNCLKVNTCIYCLNQHMFLLAILDELVMKCELTEAEADEVIVRQAEYGTWYVIWSSLNMIHFQRH